MGGRRRLDGLAFLAAAHRLGGLGRRATRFREGFGTLYTAEYRPAEGVVRYHWPDRTWEHSLDQVQPGSSIQVQLGAPE